MLAVNWTTQEFTAIGALSNGGSIMEFKFITSSSSKKRAEEYKEKYDYSMACGDIEKASYYKALHNAIRLCRGEVSLTIDEK